MGIHNKDTSNLTGKLKSGLCPYCGNKIIPNDHLHGEENIDCYDFVCDNCNPSINICMAGACFPFLESWSEFERKDLSHHFRMKRVHQYMIQNAKGLTVSIRSADFK
jgi:hypothetical protein